MELLPEDDDHIVVASPSPPTTPVFNLIDLDEVHTRQPFRVAFVEWSERAIRALVMATSLREEAATDGAIYDECRRCWYEVMQQGHEAGVHLAQLTEGSERAQADLAHVVRLSTHDAAVRLVAFAQEARRELQERERRWDATLGAWAGALQALREQKVAATAATAREREALADTREDLRARARTLPRASQWVDRILEIIDEEYEKELVSLRTRATARANEVRARALRALKAVHAPSPTPMPPEAPSHVVACWRAEGAHLEERALIRLVVMAREHVNSFVH